MIVYHHLYRLIWVGNHHKRVSGGRMYYFYHGTQHVFAFKFDEYFVLFAGNVCAHLHIIYIYITYDSLYNKRLRFSRPKVVSFYHCAATTVGGNRLYNFAHRSSRNCCTMDQVVRCEKFPRQWTVSSFVCRSRSLHHPITHRIFA